LTVHVGIDLDGCIYPFVTAYNNVFGPEGADDTAWTGYYSYRQWGITDDQFKGHLKSGAKYKFLFEREPPYPGVIAAWQRLMDMPVKVHVITHRVREAWGSTVRWLEAYGFQPDTLTFSSDKRVLEALAGLDASHLTMCEDTVSQFEQIRDHGIDAYLIDQPWNREIDTPKRVPDFSAFVDKVEEAVG
jgi:hypothetical protein